LLDFGHLTEAQLRELDAFLAPQDVNPWESFYANRAKPCAFFGRSPDESLAQWIQDGVILPGRAIDLGCGNGRNAVFLARRGFFVEAVDYSQAALAWARDRIVEAGVTVCLTHRNIFELDLTRGSYDLVYDSGCFHHIPPHRRRTYVELVAGALKPGGWFGMSCFRPEGGSGYSDEDVYLRRTLGGGLGYTEAQLREVWSNKLKVHAMRQMQKPSAESGQFGESFLWVLLAQKL
jgi:SAM-dependent methyltransferase